MSIKRVELKFEGQFTQIPNEWLRDVRLTRKARGLLAEIISHRVGWNITVKGLEKAGREGRDAILGAINELLECGYLVRIQDRREGGQFGEVEYEIAEPITANGFSGNGSPGNGFAGNGQSAPKNTIDKEHHLEEHEVQPAAAALDDLDGLPKGSRSAVALPKPFMLTPEMRSWAAERTPSVVIDAVTSDFVAYWREGDGKGKRKKNWVLTWRNWLKREHTRNLERGWKPSADDDRKVIRGGRVVA